MNKGRFREFFFQLLCVKERRRQLLQKWHQPFPVTKLDASLVDVFKRFITTLLYGTVDLCIQKHTFSVFTGKWEDRCLTIRKEWLTQQEAAFLEEAVRDKERLFMARKEYENNLYDYGDFIYKDGADTKPYDTLVDQMWRRQLLRDFVFLLMATPRVHHCLLHFVRAVQSVLLTKQAKSDVFLAALHGGLQGRFPVDQIPCWNIMPWDRHSDVVLERDVKRKREENDKRSHAKKRPM